MTSIKTTQRIYWSDLSYEKQEEIKNNFIELLRFDKDLMKELKAEVNQSLIDDEVEPELLKTLRAYRLVDKLEDLADKYIIKNFNAEFELTNY